MSLELSGLNSKAIGASIVVKIPDSHPLVLLANLINWQFLLEIILGDLTKTTKKGNINRGRKILIRVHLAAYLLQRLYNLTDRQVEYWIKDNAAYRIFCGEGSVIGFKAPDHTKVEEFRNRLSPETQRTIANHLANVAVKFGFADPSKSDWDSTTQEANIAYPSDAQLMSKLAGTGYKILNYLSGKLKLPKLNGLAIDIKGIKAKAKKYFFLGKNKSLEIRRDVFKKYFNKFKSEIAPVIKICAELPKKIKNSVPWYIRRGLDQLTELGPKYISDVAHFVRKNTIKDGKKLSFHANEVACISKRKPGKDFTFGRVFQIGRIAGNFLFVAPCTSVRMEDKYSIKPLIEEHSHLFGKRSLKSVATDKGYWSASNYKSLTKADVQEIGLQRPVNLKNKCPLSPETQEKLYNRRSGIEPLLGHAKHGGQLGRSRMKTDQGTLAAGYGSITGFNLRQLKNRIMGKPPAGMKTTQIGRERGGANKIATTQYH
jgi:IS5 family transposase